jgi:hypothetical protein
MDNFFLSITQEAVASIHDNILCADCRDDWVNNLTVRNCTSCQNKRLSASRTVAMLKNYTTAEDLIHNQIHIELNEKTALAKPGRYYIIQILKTPAKYQTFHSWIELNCTVIKGRFFTKRRFIGTIISTPEEEPQNPREFNKYVLPC